MPATPGPSGGPRKLGQAVAAGAVAGVLTSGALIGILMGTGVLRSGGSTTVAATPTAVTISASDTDASTAQAVAAKILPSVVSVSVTSASGSGKGSGVVLDTAGNIITNYHVIDGATAITVNISGKSYTAEVVGSDASSDVAVIKADLGGDTVVPAEIGDSSTLTSGSWVMTAGSPLGLDQSVSEGIVSGLARNDVLMTTSNTLIYTNLIQVDAVINPGNSGGALVDNQGKLVGITTLIQSDTETFAGIGYAIPINYAKSIADKIIAGEKVLHPFLGVNMVTVNAYNAALNRLPVNQGAYVAEVTAGSAAEAAGLKEGDIITKIDGTDVTSASSVILAVRSKNINDTVTITYLRNGQEATTTATLQDDSTVQDETSASASSGSNSSSRSGSGSSGQSGSGVTLEDLLNNLQRRRNSQGSAS